MGVWMMTYMFICIFVAGWFYMILLDILGDLIEQYWQEMELDRQEEEASKVKENVIKLKTTNEEPLIVKHNLEGEYDVASETPRIPYLERERFKGQGPVRIGVPFDFSEDLYSLMFISNLRKEY